MLFDCLLELLAYKSDINKRMRISVITATWNSGSTIEDTIQSLASQGYKNVEYIIVDGASRDNTLGIVERYHSYVAHVISEKDSGIYDALNKGIKAATGDVIGFLHSDDIYARNNTLQDIADAFSDESVDAVYGDLEYVSKENTEHIVRKWVSGSFSRKSIRNGWMPPHPTFYLRRKYYTELGGFDLSYRIAADYESILRYLWGAQLKACYIPGVMVKMRVGGESNRSLRNVLKKSCEDVRAMKQNNLPVLRAILGKNFSKIPQFFL